MKRKTLITKKKKPKNNNKVFRWKRKTLIIRNRVKTICFQTSFGEHNKLHYLPIVMHVFIVPYFSVQSKLKAKVREINNFSILNACVCNVSLGTPREIVLVSGNCKLSNLTPEMIFINCIITVLCT